MISVFGCAPYEFPKIIRKSIFAINLLVFLTVSTAAFGQTTSTVVTDPRGEKWDYTYQDILGAKKFVSKISQTDGKGQSQTYDANGNPASRTDEAGRVTSHTYNANNQKTSTTEASGTALARTTTYQYISPTVNKRTVVSAPSINTGVNKITTTTYDANLNALSVTITGVDPAGNPVSRVSNYQYNPTGQVTQIDGPRTDVNDHTTFTYNQCTIGSGCGQLATTSNALGHTTSFDTYNFGGQITQSTDPKGVVTTYSYDARYRLSTITQTPPAGQGAPRVTTYTYDPLGQIATTTAPDGIVLTYSYDQANNLRSITDNLGNQIAYSYDLYGNRTVTDIRDPDGTLVRMVISDYDIRNRMQSTNKSGSISQTDYDEVGNLVGEIDPNQNPATSHIYDELDRLVSSVDSLGKTTQYQYDVNDNLIQVQAPNNATTTYLYDDLGNLLQEVSPDRGTLNYTYDSAGNVTQIVDARGTTGVMQYDALNRLISADYSGIDEDISYIYDTCSNGTGRLCQVIDQSGTTSYEYDVWGNVIQQVKNELGQTYTTLYEYDSSDRVTKVTYPGGRVVNYGRDTVGRVTAVNTTQGGNTSNVITSRNYRADGLMTAQSFGNGLAESRLYDLEGRLVTQQIGSETGTYSYDANGNLLGLSWENASGAVSSPTAEPDSFTYEADSNRLATVDLDSITLDSAGNTLSDGTRNFAYNLAGRLSQFQVGAGDITGYVYNASGLRTQKITAHSGTVVYHYNLQGQLIAESGSDGTVVKEYLWVDGVLVAQLGLEDTFIVSDHLATPRQGFDNVGVNVWRWELDGFGFGAADGDVDGDEGVVEVNLRFPGQYFDGESGLYYNWNRYYDPKLGRYITSDPIGLGGGINTYVYALQSPGKYIDKDGRNPLVLLGVGIGGITGGINAFASGGDIIDIALGIGTGAVGGALAATGIANPILLGGLVGGGASAIGQYFGGGSIDIDKVGTDAIFGSLGGAAGAGLRILGFTERQAMIFGAGIDTAFVGPVTARADGDPCE